MIFSDSHSQELKKERALINLYGHPGKPTTQSSPQDTSPRIVTYLIKTDPAIPFKSPSFLSAHPSLRILRQLSPQHFIIATSDSGSLSPVATWIIPANDDWKLSPSLLVATGKTDTWYSLIVAVTDLPAFKAHLSELKEPVRILEEYPAANLLKLYCRRSNFSAHILPLTELIFADLSQTTPKEEQVINDFDLSANSVTLAHREFPAIAGRGLTVSVREDRFDTADIDFKGRVLNTPLTASLLSSHATIMATIIGGGGNSYYSGQGVAYQSTVSSFNFTSLLPDPDSVYRQVGISVQNHSYGTNIENYYGAEAVAHDLSANNNPSLLHVFSSGNSGDQSATQGQYNGISGMADLTGNFKMAKNILTVGSIDSFGTVLTLSSKGPAFDGRVKPELVAFGQDGSSGAAAIVSGISLLLQQSYKEQHNGQLPPSDLVKAVLLNSADDAGPPGIDYSAGYGSANAWRALTTMQEKKYFTGSLQTGGIQSYTLSIPPHTKMVKITLAWNDPAAQPNAYTALVNDLDLELYHPASGATWLPWTLNPYPSVDSLQALPLRKRDSLNNTEQVSLDDPPAGNYTLLVKGYAVPAGPQSYSLAYQWDSLNAFKWAYPAKTDNIIAGASNLLRWTTTLPSPAILEYSLDSGSNWHLIDPHADLSKRNHYWQAPDTAAAGILRVTAGSQVFYSDTFTISRPASLSVGFNCQDSVFLYWPPLKGVDTYQVYSLGDQWLEPFMVVKDSFLVFSRSHPSLYYAVAPILPFGATGIKSYTINYTTQGVDCYWKSFTADRQGDRAALLNLELGTLYQVKNLSFEKQSATGYASLALIEPVKELQYAVPDESLSQGSNTYRVKITLQDGRTIYSEDETIDYLAGKDYLLYPNPLGGQSLLNILSADPAGKVLQLFNTLGQKVYEGKLTRSPQQIPVGRLAKGLYFFRILKDGKRATSGKIVIN